MAAAQMIIPVAARTQEGAQALLDAIKCRAFQADAIAWPLKRCATHRPPFFSRHFLAAACSSIAQVMITRHAGQPPHVCGPSDRSALSLRSAVPAAPAWSHDMDVTCARLANHLSEDVGKLGFRGTICNNEAKWEHAKMGHAPPIWFVFSGAHASSCMSCPLPNLPSPYPACRTPGCRAYHFSCLTGARCSHPASHAVQNLLMHGMSLTSPRIPCRIPGNGSQWPKMAEPLLHSSRVFRNAIRACADALRPHNIDLLAEFAKEEGWKQPALAMVGLVAVQARARMRCLC